jgi:magnesium transporter
METTRVYQFSPKAPPAKIPDVVEGLRTLKKGGFIWGDFSNPSGEDLAPLVETLGIHPLAIEDCFDEKAVSKIETYPGHIFALFNSVTYHDQDLSTNEVGFFIGANYLLTVHGAKNKSSQLFEAFRTAVERPQSEAAKGVDFLFHVILDYIIDRKIDAIDKLHDDIEIAEERVIKQDPTFSPEDLLYLRSCLLSLRKTLFHEREILIKICRKDFPFVTEKAIYYYRDIYDHLTKFLESVEINREMISNLLELYISMQSNRMAVVSNQTNEIMKRLTLITTIFMPMTLLSGVGGMSEWSMIMGPENWKISYPLFLLLLLLLGVFNYAFFKWKKWI